MIVENPKELGFMDNGTGKHQSNTVYDENALCPNITTIQGWWYAADKDCRKPDCCYAWKKSNKSK